MRDALKKAVWVGVLVIGAIAAFQMPIGAQEPAPGRKVIKRLAPIYPPLAKKAGMTGTVKVVTIILPDGTVKSVRTIGGNALFIAAAETAVKGWTFEPSKDDTTEVVTVQFTR
jgi:TonB family protein